MNSKFLTDPIQHKVLGFILMTLFIVEPIAAKTVKITMTAKENTVVIDK